MEYAYHFQVQHVFAAFGGQRERRHELRSEYYQKAEPAMMHLNSCLTAMQDDNGHHFLPVPVAKMEADLASDCMYSNMVFLNDRTHKFLTINRVSVQ